jgi:hypothetical protein
VASAVLDTKEGIMKKQILILVSVLSLLLAAGSAFAQAQQIKFEVPFNFIVDGAQMPAGTYLIRNVGMGGTLAVTGMYNNATKLVNPNYAESIKASDRTRLVFHCYGTRYFLAEIWTQGSDRGRQLPKSAAESEVAMDFTSHNVILTASLR